MVDGPTEARDLHLTEENRGRVRAFVQEVWMGRDHGALADWVDPQRFVEHHPQGRDGLEPLRQHLSEPAVQYETLHRVLACGDFVLAMVEGRRHGVHSAFYELFRVESGRVVEHWNTVEAVAPREQWKHDHGKF